jgi:Phosphotransferase enzyme family
MDASAPSRPAGLPEAISIWCQRWLDAMPVRVLFQSGHLSEVWGLTFAQRPPVVIKIRPQNRRLTACTLVQQHLWTHGFPCPEVLTGPAPLGDSTATAEAFVQGGGQLTTGSEAPGRFADALARLIALAPAVESLPTLDPSPPWVGWDHHQPGTWPEPDDVEADLNAQAGPSWIEEVGARVRNRLLRPSSVPLVVGHGDWESQNLRWIDRQLHVVHDWDSVVAQREATIAGAASAVFTATGAPNTSASVAQSAAFLAAYEQARDRRWSDEERELAWAAGLWVRVFNAKKATFRPDSEQPSLSRLRLEAEAVERLRRAGA